MSAMMGRATDRRAALGTRNSVNGTANFGRDIPTGISGPPPEVIPNIPVRKNRNGPFHLISDRNFRNLWHNGKHPRSLRSRNETNCQHVQIPQKPVIREWCKSHFTSKYGKSDPHIDYSAFELLSLQDGRVCNNNSANNYIHCLVERQDFITILQSYLGKHFGICYVQVLRK